MSTKNFVAKQAHGTKNPSATKKGPGRFHEQGFKRVTQKQAEAARALQALQMR